jgi:PAS domain S-box-containing protein
MSNESDAIEARLAERLFNISSVGMAQVEPLTRRFLRVNAALCAITGYGEAELLAMTVDELNHPDDRARDREAYAGLAQGGSPYQVEKRYVRKGGGVVWVRVTGDLLRDAGGRALRAFAVIEDISEHQRGEERLRESEGRLALIFERALVGLSEIAADGRFLRANAELGRIVGRDPQTLCRLSFGDVTHPEDVPPSLAAAQRVLAQGGNATLEKRYRRPDGTLVVAQSSLTRLEAPDGGEARLLAVTVDLTARRRAEAALRASEARFSAIANLVPDLLWSTDPAGRADWFSRRWSEYTGQSEAEACGDGWAAVVHPDDRETAVARWRSALQHEQPLDNELRLRARQGSWRWHLVRAEPQRDEAGRVVRWFGSATDIHEQRSAREVLEQRVQERTHALRTLLARVEHVQDEERRRIARELHYSLGQYLTSLSLAVSALARQSDPALRERLAALQQPMQQVDRELDRLVFTLRPTALEDCGLGDAVAAHVATWSELSGIPVDLAQHGLDGQRLPAPVEAAVFRVIQEALNNVTKHAGATHVSVSVERSRRQLRASVEDDGVGFEPAEERDALSSLRTGWGVLGMKERIESLGGHFIVESQPGAGTTVLLRVPLDGEALSSVPAARPL